MPVKYLTPEEVVQRTIAGPFQAPMMTILHERS
jgi:hypothetical protein